MIRFDQLSLEKLVFEVRYKGPLYLDRCGSVWAALEERFPGISPSGVDTTGATFRIKDRATTIQFGSALMHVTEDFPSSITSLCEVADFLLPLIVKTFQLDVFQRIGTRYIFVMPVAEQSEADELLLKTDLVRLADHRVRLFGNLFAEIGLKFIIQDDDQGYIFNLASASRELTGDFPRPIAVDDHKLARRILIVDIDHFTRKPVGSGAASASDIVRTGYKNIENNINSFFRSEKT